MTEGEKSHTPIKSCPHCGVEARVTYDSLSNVYFVECLWCYARSGFWSTKKVAIRSWNEREGNESRR